MVSFRLSSTIRLGDDAIQHQRWSRLGVERLGRRRFKVGSVPAKDQKCIFPATTPNTDVFQMTTQVRKNGVARLQSYEEAWQRSGSSIDSKIGRNSCDQIGCTKVLRSTIESSSPPKKSVVDHRYPVETGDWSLDVPIWRLRRRQPLTLGHQYSHRNAETTIYGTKVAV